MKSTELSKWSGPIAETGEDILRERGSSQQSTSEPIKVVQVSYVYQVSIPRCNAPLGTRLRQNPEAVN